MKEKKCELDNCSSHRYFISVVGQFHNIKKICLLKKKHVIRLRGHHFLIHVSVIFVGENDSTVAINNDFVNDDLG